MLIVVHLNGRKKMNKYDPHDYCADTKPEQLHFEIAQLKIDVNGLLGDLARKERDIEQLREALGRHL